MALYFIQDTDDMPKNPGVFSLYNVEEDLIFIGKANQSIRDGIQGQLTVTCTARANFYDFEVTDQYDQRLAELLAQYKAKHGGELPRCNASAAAVGYAR